MLCTCTFCGKKLRNTRGSRRRNPWFVFVTKEVGYCLKHIDPRVSDWRTVRADFAVPAPVAGRPRAR